MDIVIIEIDLDENSCSLAGMDALGRVVLRRRMQRSRLEFREGSWGRCHIVERRTREFCVPNIFKRPRLPRATCS